MMSIYAMFIPIISNQSKSGVGVSIFIGIEVMELDCKIVSMKLTFARLYTYTFINYSFFLSKRLKKMLSQILPGYTV